MLYWGIFTSGFIIGGIVASFIFDRRNTMPPVFKSQKKLNYKDMTFDQLTQINYSSPKLGK